MNPANVPHDEEQLAELLRALRPVPEGWSEAAKELPAARRSLDDLIERARADAELRIAVIADLEAALEREGVEPIRPFVEELRRQLCE
jgi:hypothetical protein